MYPRVHRLLPRCRPAATLAVAVLLAGAAGRAGAQGREVAGRPAPAAALSRALEDVVARVLPSVVQVVAVRTPDDAAVDALEPFGGDPAVVPVGMGRGAEPDGAPAAGLQQTGSGFVVDPAGYVLTNAHVVRGARRVRVLLAGPSRPHGAAPGIVSVEASVAGVDDPTDLALLRITPDALALVGLGGALPSLPFGDSRALRPGRLVIAAGSPHGLKNSVSVGVVSAPARELEPDAAHVFVQTDAPITVGSSGGPLVDVSGEVVGVNMAMVSRSGGNEGVGLALPSGVARAVYAELRAHGRVRRGDIGATAQTVTPLLAAGLGLARPAGVIVSDVEPGGPAERAGVRVGDRVLAVDGRPIAGARELAGALVPRAPGDTLRLAVERGGHHGREAVERLDARVLVAEHRAPADPRERLRSRAPDAVAELGVVAVELDDSTAALSGGRVQPGVLVTSAPPRGAPSEDGLTAGDVVVWANGARVRTPAELRQAVHAAAPGAAVAMQVLRRGALRFVAAERR